MISREDINIDEETITKVGLRLSEKHINAQIAPNARIFQYPYLEDVFIMESDLYGNTMPKNSCFLAFYGEHGLMGEPLEVQKLRTAKLEDIKKIVQRDNKG